MERDLSKYPNDENGNVLWHLAKKGFNLEGEAEVRFAMIFPEFDNALKFGVFLLRHEYRVKVHPLEDRAGYAGELLVDIFMDVSHEEITGAEEWLKENSASIGGVNDGWQLQYMPSNLVKAEWSNAESLKS